LDVQYMDQHLGSTVSQIVPTGPYRILRFSFFAFYHGRCAGMRPSAGSVCIGSSGGLAKQIDQFLETILGGQEWLYTVRRRSATGAHLDIGTVRYSLGAASADRLALGDLSKD